jgi:hypothetical protein
LGLQVRSKGEVEQYIGAGVPIDVFSFTRTANRFSRKRIGQINLAVEKIAASPSTAVMRTRVGAWSRVEREWAIRPPYPPIRAKKPSRSTKKRITTMMIEPHVAVDFYAVATQ